MNIQPKNHSRKWVATKRHSYVCYQNIILITNSSCKNSITDCTIVFINTLQLPLHLVNYLTVDTPSLQLLIDNISDANGWSYLHEVGCQATI